MAMPPCGGGPYGEGIEQEPELLPLLGLVHAEQREHPLLHVAAVDTDGAAADLVAVAHDVVGVGQRLSRVVGEPVDPVRVRRGERVVHGGPAELVALVVPDPLEHRRVDDPDERPRALVDQPAAPGDLAARGTEERAGVGRVPGAEEDGVARPGADGLGQPLALGVGEVLGHRAAERAVVADGDVGQAAGAALAGPLLPGVELPGAAGSPRRA